MGLRALSDESDNVCYVNLGRSVEPGLLAPSPRVGSLIAARSPPHRAPVPRPSPRIAGAADSLPFGIAPPPTRRLEADRAGREGASRRAPLTRHSIEPRRRQADGHRQPPAARAWRLAPDVGNARSSAPDSQILKFGRCAPGGYRAASRSSRRMASRTPMIPPREAQLQA